MSKGWIGVDLDGTLAEYEGWKGVQHIGDPITVMVDRVKQWISEGKEVKIFTARVFKYNADEQEIIQKWLEKHIGKRLSLTATKDYGMIELWDDRAVQVIPNTGERADGKEESIRLYEYMINNFPYSCNSHNAEKYDHAKKLKSTVEDIAIFVMEQLKGAVNKEDLKFMGYGIHNKNKEEQK